MESRKGQFRSTMKKRFGPAKAVKAERCVKDLKGKYGSDSRAPYAICTASMAGTRRDRGR
jgi:hypothetical protein